MEELEPATTDEAEATEPLDPAKVDNVTLRQPPRRPVTGGGVPLSEAIGAEAAQKLANDLRDQRIAANKARYKKYGRIGMIRRAHGMRVRPRRPKI